jgi:hypothetical protein
LQLEVLERSPGDQLQAIASLGTGIEIQKASTSTTIRSVLMRSGKIILSDRSA